MCIFRTPKAPAPAPPPPKAPPPPEKTPEALENAMDSNAELLKKKKKGARGQLGRGRSGLQVAKKATSGVTSALKIGGMS